MRFKSQTGDAQSAEELIRQELYKMPAERGLIVNEHYAKIRCPNREHKNGQETRPSFKISLQATPGTRGIVPAGWGYCWACKCSLSWNEIAELYSLKKLGRWEKPPQNLEFTWDSNAILGQEAVCQLPPGSQPWPQDTFWRNINGKTVRQIGGQQSFLPEFNETCCCLPVYVHKELKGYVKAKIIPIKGTNYYNSPGTWANRWGLFPYDPVKKMLTKNNKRVLALVEGPRDALNLIQYNFPALANLGANGSWSDYKKNLILELDPDLLILMADPDEAGQRMAAQVAASLQGQVDLKYFKFPNNTAEKFDASDLSATQVQRLHEKYSK